MLEWIRLNPGKALASAQVVLAICAAIGYLAMKDYRRALYWFFAACLTATVTY